MLSQSDGIDLERSFGPTVGAAPYTVNGADQVRVVVGNGMSTEVGSVDVYSVSAPATATLVTDPKVTVGDPTRRALLGAAPAARDHLGARRRRHR